MSLGPFRWLRRIWVVTIGNLKSIPTRPGSSASVVLGVAGVVIVLVGIYSVAQGFRSSMLRGISSSNAIVLQAGTDSEFRSLLTLDEARLISLAPGIARSPDGGPLASPELYTVVTVPYSAREGEANIVFRGVQNTATQVRDSFHIESGRMFEPGSFEFIVGEGAANQFEGLRPGSTIELGQATWTSVGTFTTGGAADSEIWCDAVMLQQLFARNSFQSVRVVLEGPQSLTELREALEQDARIQARVVPERVYYARQSAILTTLLTALGTMVGLLMALAATLGALSTMFTAVAARHREIATLRALGYSAGPILFSILSESLLLAGVGGGVGLVVVYVLFDGYRTATLNWQTFSQVAFTLEITPSLVVIGMTFAIAIGIAGGLLPALRAVRLPVAPALRDL